MEIFNKDVYLCANGFILSFCHCLEHFDSTYSGNR